MSYFQTLMSLTHFALSMTLVFQFHSFQDIIYFLLSSLLVDFFTCGFLSSPITSWYFQAIVHIIFISFSVLSNGNFVFSHVYILSC